MTQPPLVPSCRPSFEWKGLAGSRTGFVVQGRGGYYHYSLINCPGTSCVHPLRERWNENTSELKRLTPYLTEIFSDLGDESSIIVVLANKSSEVRHCTTSCRLKHYRAEHPDLRKEEWKRVKCKKARIEESIGTSQSATLVNSPQVQEEGNQLEHLKQLHQMHLDRLLKLELQMTVLAGNSTPSSVVSNTSTNSEQLSPSPTLQLTTTAQSKHVIPFVPGTLTMPAHLSDTNIITHSKINSSVTTDCPLQSSIVVLSSPTPRPRPTPLPEQNETEPILTPHPNNSLSSMSPQNNTLKDQGDSLELLAITTASFSEGPSVISSRQIAVGGTGNGSVMQEISLQQRIDGALMAMSTIKAGDNDIELYKYFRDERSESDDELAEDMQDYQLTSKWHLLPPEFFKRCFKSKCPLLFRTAIVAHAAQKHKNTGTVKTDQKSTLGEFQDTHIVIGKSGRRGVKR
ncbi:UNVERIFIED_CONTAM: hypothetical protein HDU68_012655 [Siphonaria sp. JEL0065]|nr:hypothetical protein HDU68_012655 [Siphonaria sp. JEL0065]